METEETARETIPEQRNEDWRFGRPHVWGRALYEHVVSAGLHRAVVEGIEYTDIERQAAGTGIREPLSVGSQGIVQEALRRAPECRCYRVPDGFCSEEPMILRSETGGDSVLNQHIIIGAGARVHIIEEHYNRGAAYAVNLRSYEIQSGAVLKLEQREHGDGEASVFCVSNFICAEGVRLCVMSTHDGHRWARHEQTTELNGEDGDVLMLSANRLKGEQWLDIRTRQVHTARACKSRLLCKNVSGGEARVIFGGNIRVQPEAQETDAYLTNLNLLMSPRCTVHTLPGLEILADRVKCSHGAASAPLDPEQLFYLQTRGIVRADAENLLVEAFLGEVRQKFEGGG